MVVRQLAQQESRLRAVATRLAAWDVASALAEVAHRDDWTRPVVDDSLDLVLEDARHPVVEKLAAEGRFVPNDISLSAGEGNARLWLVEWEMPSFAGGMSLALTSPTGDKRKNSAGIPSATIRYRTGSGSPRDRA